MKPVKYFSNEFAMNSQVYKQLCPTPVRPHGGFARENFSIIAHFICKLNSSSSLDSRSVPWLGNASVCRLKVIMFCAILCHISCRSRNCLGSLSTAWLVSLVVFSCYMWLPSGDTRGPSVVFEAVDMPCVGPFHVSHSVDYI